MAIGERAWLPAGERASKRRPSRSQHTSEHDGQHVTRACELSARVSERAAAGKRARAGNASVRVPAGGRERSGADERVCLQTVSIIFFSPH